MSRAILKLAVILVVCAALAPPASAARRLALVIGNSDYQHTTTLKNAHRDAADMAAALKRLGFEVQVGVNLTEDRFADMISRFSASLADADVALFFYAGHGIQYRNRNYLIPVDARLAGEFRLKREAIALNDIIDQMEAQVPVNLVFLDACRTNPLADNLRGNLKGKGRSGFVGRGLARIEASGNDTLITFAAAPGTEAADGVGQNSPFTKALLKHIESPGVEIEVMLKRVTRDVRNATRSRQEPERLSRLSVEFYFAKKGERKPSPSAPKVTTKTPAPESPSRTPSAGSQAMELAFWNSIKDSQDKVLFEAYLTQYPAGVFAPIAKARIAALSRAAAPAEVKEDPPKAAKLPKVRVFRNPKYKGYWVDRCRIWARECDRPAADEFCRRMGYRTATDFSWNLRKPTRILTSGLICNANFCGGFSKVVCAR